MTSQQLDDERIFHVARGIQDLGLRSEYLDQVCAGDQALRERVEALLKVHEQEQGFLNSASPEAAPTVEQLPVTEAVGQQIGRYKLLQKIGEGGCKVFLDKCLNDSASNGLVIFNDQHTHRCNDCKTGDGGVAAKRDSKCRR